MNKTELKLKVIKLSKTLKRNELYDYIIAKYFASDRVSKGLISVADLEKITGLKIKDVAMMNKLLFYWTTFLSEEQLIQKAANILMVVDTYTSDERDEFMQQHRIEDELLSYLNKIIEDDSKDVT